MTTTLSHLAELAQGRLALADAASTEDVDKHGAVAVGSISLDSSALREDSIFAALPGTRSHGARYAAGTPALAILTDEAGLELLKAAGETRPVIVVEDIRAILGNVAAEIYGHPTRELTVLGVTGTSGKTTTSYLIEEGLLAAGHSVGLIGTTGTRINREPVPTSLTTPEAPRLQELFKQMLNAGVSHVVMEVSSHALELGRVQGTQFAVGGFTNLSQDHLDFHPTMEDYFQAKKKLFVGPVAADKAVICVDDEWGQRLADEVDGATRVATKGSDHAVNAGVSARMVSTQPTGEQRVSMSVGDAEWEFDLPLPGDFNVANAAVATAMVAAVGVDAQDFTQAIAQVAVPGRMQRVDEGQSFIAVVDYAHKPAAVAAVLDTLREQLDNAGQGGRIGIVVGAGGDRDSSKRPIMGAAAAERADYVVVTDDNPRTEDPAPIRAAVIAGAREAAENAGATGHQVEIVEEGSRAAAIDAVVAWAQPGDAVIVVGKGHEVGQIVGTVTHHFDDREELSRALQQRLVTDESEK